MRACPAGDEGDEGDEEDEGGGEGLEQRSLERRSPSGQSTLPPRAHCACARASLNSHEGSAN